MFVFPIDPVLAYRIYIYIHPFTILNMYAVIIAVCNIRVFICVIIFKPALTNKVVNACPKTLHISLYKILCYIIYITLYLSIYIHSSCLHLFWQVFETPCPTKHGMVINLLLYSRESKGLVVAINSFSSFILKESSHYYT